MRNIKVVFFDIKEKTIVEHESMPDGEIMLGGTNGELYNDIFLKVNEFKMGSRKYIVESRCFVIGDDKLILYVNRVD
ncbi:MAG: hypothetical protein N2645_13875 [Clostridia bacterium]|nr:hypothetical protein [Clostridia bacterium]